MTSPARATDRGLVLGVALHDADGGCYLVSPSCEGELLVFDVGTRAQLARRCLERGWRVYGSVGHLVDALRSGLCFGASPPLSARIHCVALGSASAPYD